MPVRERRVETLKLTIIWCGDCNQVLRGDFDKDKMDTALARKVLHTEKDLLAYLLDRNLTWLGAYKKLMGTDRDRARVGLIRRINAAEKLETDQQDLDEAICETLNINKNSRWSNTLAANRAAAELESETVKQDLPKAGNNITNNRTNLTELPESTANLKSGVISSVKTESKVSKNVSEAEHVHEKTSPHGTGRNGVPRWKCKCGKTFVEHPADWIDGRKKPRAKRAKPHEPKDSHDKYVQRMREEGRCTRCGTPCSPYALCEAHRNKANDNYKARVEKAAQDDKMNNTNGSGTGRKPHVWDYDAVRIAAKECALVGEVAEKLGVHRNSISNANRDDAKFREAFNQGKAERFVCVACGGPISTGSIPGVSKCRKCFLTEEFPAASSAPAADGQIQSDLIVAEDPESVETPGAAGAVDQHSDAESESMDSSIEPSPALEPERTFFGRSIPADERVGGLIPTMDDHGTGEAVDRHLPGSLPKFLMELDEQEVEGGVPKLPHPDKRADVQGKAIALTNSGRLVVGFDGNFFDLTAKERTLLCTIAELLQQNG